jgi:hypothetical protein
MSSGNRRPGPSRRPTPASSSAMPTGRRSRMSISSTNRAGARPHIYSRRMRPADADPDERNLLGHCGVSRPSWTGTISTSHNFHLTRQFPVREAPRTTHAGLSFRSLPIVRNGRLMRSGRSDDEQPLSHHPNTDGAMLSALFGCLTSREERRLSLARRSLAQHAPKEQRGNLPYDGKQAQFGNRQYQPQIHRGHPLRSCAA